MVRGSVITFKKINKQHEYTQKPAPQKLWSLSLRNSFKGNKPILAKINKSKTFCHLLFAVFQFLVELTTSVTAFFEVSDSIWSLSFGWFYNGHYQTVHSPPPNPRKPLPTQNIFPKTLH